MKPATAPKVKTYIPSVDFVPEAGRLGEIQQGIFWLRTPLPFELNHINLWLLEGPGGWSIIDTGFNAPETVIAWEAIFADRFAKKPVTEIFVTHFHPDHFGLAGWLAEKTGLRIKMTAPEFETVQRYTREVENLSGVYAPYYTAAGVDDETVAELLKRRFNYSKIVYKPPAAIDAVKPGDTVTLGGTPWLVVGGYGHCPEHACLYSAEKKLLIAGDIVLPDISPNISYYPGSAEDPVAEYLMSLDDIKARIPDDVVVLPSHGVPFRGLHRRIDELKNHHDRRFRRMHDVLRDGPKTAYETMQGLFSHRKLGRGDIFFALGETLAHLRHDEKHGIVQKTLRNGVAFYNLK